MHRPNGFYDAMCKSRILFYCATQSYCVCIEYVYMKTVKEYIRFQSKRCPLLLCFFVLYKEKYLYTFFVAKDAFRAPSNSLLKTQEKYEQTNKKKTEPMHSSMQLATATHFYTHARNTHKRASNLNCIKHIFISYIYTTIPKQM